MHTRAFVDDEAERCTKEAELADRLDRRNATIVAFLGFVGVVLTGALLIVGETIL
ncbi:MAG: hypothetical protein V7618_04730 [Rhodoglobus sp.]|uniref:hypothetical protein n=1 Tax=uncultured Salinibacterium sp. TaxID=459274 RepID=UPI0030DA117E|tara:strand:- start:130810 stop:130974 length:165 start_codon:yes stop_codon:yes gene_type:complete